MTTFTRAAVPRIQRFWQLNHRLQLQRAPTVDFHNGIRSNEANATSTVRFRPQRRNRLSRVRANPSTEPLRVGACRAH
jgi:hypothetical protein